MSDENNNKKVFLVEDDAAIIDIYETMMKRAGVNFEVLSLGQDVINKIKAIEKGETAKPVLILLDLILPDMNGVEVLTQIKKNEATKDVAVFILTNQENAEKQLPEGITADKIIIKANTSPTDLLEIIQKQIS